jgi:hypothetical protein
MFPLRTHLALPTLSVNLGVPARLQLSLRVCNLHLYQ